MLNPQILEISIAQLGTSLVELLFLYYLILVLLVKVVIDWLANLKRVFLNCWKHVETYIRSLNCVYHSRYGDFFFYLIEIITIIYTIIILSKLVHDERSLLFEDTILSFLCFRNEAWHFWIHTSLIMLSSCHFLSAAAVHLSQNFLCLQFWKFVVLIFLEL